MDYRHCALLSIIVTCSDASKITCSVNFARGARKPNRPVEPKFSTRISREISIVIAHELSLDTIEYNVFPTVALKGDRVSFRKRTAGWFNIWSVDFTNYTLANAKVFISLVRRFISNIDEG
jgi:hypothetical protein